MQFETRVLVEKELWGKATQEEVLFLEEDLHEWRDELTALIAEIDRGIATAKVEILGKSISSQEHFEKKREFERFKTERMNHKSLALVRLRDIKARIKEINLDDSQHNANILLNILDELKKISALMEKTK